MGLLAPTGDNALFPGLGQGPGSLGSVLGLRWNCGFNPLVALRENGRVMVDLDESITDAEKKKNHDRIKISQNTAVAASSAV